MAFEDAQFVNFTNESGEPINDTNLMNIQKWALLNAHPVGSYYWSEKDTDPSRLFGGTWTRVKDIFLHALGDSGEAGDTGGNSSHTLDVSGIYAMANPTGSGLNYKNATSSFTTDYYIDGGSFTKAFGGRSNSNAGIKIEGTLNSGDNLPPYIDAYCWKRTA